MNFGTIFDVIIGSAIGTGIINFIFKFFDKSFDDWRENKKRKQKNKQQLADEIIKICTEATSSSYAKSPRSVEHIHYILNQIEGIDKKVMKYLEIFLSSWQLYSHMQTSKADSYTKEDIKFCSELLKRIEKLKEKLIENAHRLKK